MTTWVDDRGVVHFRPDIYGRDRRAMARWQCPGGRDVTSIPRQCHG